MDSSIHAHTPPKPKSSPGWMITIAAAAAFLATFNETFLNVAFAPIMADFGVDVNTVQWLNHWLSFSCRNLCAKIGRASCRGRGTRPRRAGAGYTRHNRRM